MRTYFRRIAIAAVAVVGIATLTPSSVHATTEPANANATIIAPIGIANTVDLEFASIVPGAGGTVTVDTADTRTSCAGVTACTGTVTSALFTVTGLALATYAITLPADGTITITNGAVTMPVNTFTSAPDPTGTLSLAGSQILTVGATLTVGAAQAVGSYTDTFDVIVNYN